MHTLSRHNNPLSTLWDGLRSDYMAVKSSPHRRERSGVASSGSGADYHYRNESNFLKLIEIARDIERNDPICKMAIRRLVRNVVQTGFRPDPQTGDEDFDQRIVDKWEEWKSPVNCDLEAQASFLDFEKLALKHMLVDGDVFFLPLKSGQLQAREAHRVRTPTWSKQRQTIVHGIEMDNLRRRRRVWITQEDVNPNRAVRINDFATYKWWDTLQHEQVFHVYLPDRFSQTRGVSIFAPIVDLVTYHDDIQFAQLVKQQISSCFAIIRTKKEFIPGLNTATDVATEQTYSDNKDRLTEDIYPGYEIIGEPDEDITGFSPSVPNAEYFKHVSLILSIIAVNLELPVAVLLLDPSQTNFSGWRGAIEQARQGWRALQSDLCERFHKKVYRWKLRQWIKSDDKFAAAARKVSNPLSCEWKLPGWPYIEPAKDIQADIAAIKGLQNSPRRIFAKRGHEYNLVMRELVEDNGYAILLALEKASQINLLYPEANITWQECMAVPTPDVIRMNWSKSESETVETAGNQNENA